MEITITATEANRQFSKILRNVRQGKRYAITSHGEVVAKLLPNAGDSGQERRRRLQAHRELMEHLRSQPAVQVGAWRRDDAYDESVGESE